MNTGFPKVTKTIILKMVYICFLIKLIVLEELVFFQNGMIP